MRKILLSTLLLLLVGCAASIQNLTRTQYLNDGFDGIKLKEGGLAIFPVTAGQGQEGYRRPLGDQLNFFVKEAFKDIKTIPWQETMDLLNSAGKVSAYEDLILSYNQTSILNRERVQELSDALNVKYALFCSLQDFSEKRETTYNVFTGWGTTRVANVQAHCLVVDLKSGDVMEEIIGHVGSEASSILVKNQNYEEYAKALSHAVVSRLPGSILKSLKEYKK